MNASTRIPALQVWGTYAIMAVAGTRVAANSPVRRALGIVILATHRNFGATPTAVSSQSVRAMQDTLEIFNRHVTPYVLDVKREYEAIYPGKRTGIYHFADWRRVAFASEFVAGDNVLDVGVGNGALLHILHRSGRHRRIVGIDVRRNSKLRLPENAEFHEMNVCNLNFRDGEFDTVVCMEVIEHLPVDQVDRALAELRRVTRSRLLMSVPYREPFPLYHQDKPTGHKQSFDEEKMYWLFPHAIATLIPRGSQPWTFIVEQKPEPPLPFALVSEPEFRQRVLPGSASWVSKQPWQTSLVNRIKRRAKRIVGRFSERFAVPRTK